jgi:hypothetical protein
MLVMKKLLSGNDYIEIISIVRDKLFKKIVKDILDGGENENEIKRNSKFFKEIIINESIFCLYDNNELYK